MKEKPNAANDVPLVGHLEPLANYMKRGHPKIQSKVANFDPSKTAKLRQVKRDGCCFYRSFMFGMFEYLVNNKSAISPLLQLIQDNILPLIEKAGYPKDTVDEYIQEVMDYMRQLQDESADIAKVESIFNDPTGGNFIIVFARLLVGSHMKCNPDMYQPFLINHSSVEEFCKKEVDPMWAEAEQLQISALTTILNVQAEIVYFDMSPGDQPARHYFPETGSPWMQLLYLPGHYDVLYSK